jgi:hypothetical protein
LEKTWNTSKLPAKSIPQTATTNTDLTDRSFGIPRIDFLKYGEEKCDNIITNPPYKHALEFVLQAKKYARYKKV